MSSSSATVTSYPITTTLDTMAEAGFQEADNYLLITRLPGSDAAAIQQAIEQQTAQLPTGDSEEPGRRGTPLGSEARSTRCCS